MLFFPRIKGQVYQGSWTRKALPVRDWFLILAVKYRWAEVSPDLPVQVPFSLTITSSTDPLLRRFTKQPGGIKPVLRTVLRNLLGWIFRFIAGKFYLLQSTGPSTQFTHGHCHVGTSTSFPPETSQSGLSHLYSYPDPTHATYVFSKHVGALCSSLFSPSSHRNRPYVCISITQLRIPPLLSVKPLSHLWYLLKQHTLFGTMPYHSSK